MNEVKWQDGQDVKQGQYIQPKIYFTPETVSVDTADGKREHVQLHRRWKGAGRFKSGLAIGTTSKGEPVTMLIDIRIGNIPKAQTSGASITKIEL